MKHTSSLSLENGLIYDMTVLKGLMSLCIQEVYLGHLPPANRTIAYCWTWQGNLYTGPWFIQKKTKFCRNHNCFQVPNDYISHGMLHNYRSIKLLIFWTLLNIQAWCINVAFPTEFEPQSGVVCAQRRLLSACASAFVQSDQSLLSSWGSNGIR